MQLKNFVKCHVTLWLTPFIPHAMFTDTVLYPPSLVLRIICIASQIDRFSYAHTACDDVGGQFVYYDPSCLNPGRDPRGGEGCNAGGQGQGCRFGQQDLKLKSQHNETDKTMPNDRFKFAKKTFSLSLTNSFILF